MRYSRLHILLPGHLTFKKLVKTVELGFCHGEQDVHACTTLCIFFFMGAKNEALPCAWRMWLALIGWTNRFFSLRRWAVLPLLIYFWGSFLIDSESCGERERERKTKGKERLGKHSLL